MAFEGSSKGDYVTPEFPLIDYKCHLTRSHNETRPDGLTWSDRIELDVVATSKHDTRIYQWYVNRSLMSGHLLFNDGPDDDSEKVKEIFFKDALCYGISEKYDIGDKAKRILHLSIVADVTTFDDVELKSNAISPFIQTK